MSRASRTDRAGRAASTARAARAGLPVRIILIALAVACLAVAALAAVNLHAVSAFNQATASLTRNIEDSGKDTVDYGKLRTRQEQTDAQFEQAASMEPVLLPSVKAAIQANAAVSARLTELAKLRLSEQQEGSGAQNDAAQSQPQQQ